MCLPVTLTAGKPVYTRGPVMCIGDSMTLGHNGTTNLDSGGYRIPLRELAPDLVMVGRIDGYGPHDGVGGNTIAQITARVTGAVVDSFAPSLILLLAGYNDLSIPHTPAVAAADYCTLATMYAQRSCAPLVLVGNLPPNANSAIASFNAALASAFSGAPANVHLVDIASSMILATDVGTDGVHPTASGYAKMAAGWAANLPAGP